MTDSNLPPQLANDSNFNDEKEPKMRKCGNCLGTGNIGKIMRKDCPICFGDGIVPMTEWEIREEAISRESDED